MEFFGIPFRKSIIPRIYFFPPAFFFSSKSPNSGIAFFDQNKKISGFSGSGPRVFAENPMEFKISGIRIF